MNRQDEDDDKDWDSSHEESDGDEDNDKESDSDDDGVEDDDDREDDYDENDNDEDDDNSDDEDDDDRARGDNEEDFKQRDDDGEETVEGNDEYLGRENRMDEQYYDTDPPPHDENDPEYADVDPRGHPVDYYHSEYDTPDDEERGFLDEHQDEEEKKKSGGERCLMVLALLCCCILLIIVLGLLLYFLVFRGSSREGPPKSNIRSGEPTWAPVQPAQVPSQQTPVSSTPFSYPTITPSTPEPTVGPTVSPTRTLSPSITVVKDPTLPPTKYPTVVPTRSVSPTREIEELITLIPIEDTYIINGFEKGWEHGDEETFLVQNAIDHVNRNPDSYALLNFDMSTVPFGKIMNREKKAILELNHEVSTLQRSNASYIVERLPSEKLVIESLNYEIFGGVPENGIKGQVFRVRPSDKKVEIDVSDLIFRLYNPVNDSRALIMIASHGGEVEEGDYFWSREVPGKEPKLHIFVNDTTIAPAALLSARPSVQPSAIPSKSVQPSAIPSKSLEPSVPPTVGSTAKDAQ